MVRLPSGVMDREGWTRSERQLVKEFEPAPKPNEFKDDG